MFNIKKLLKIDKKNTKTDQKTESSLKDKLRDKSKDLTNALQKSIDLAKAEFSLIREKIRNLRETNYNLGVKHLESGNLTDAVIRFKIITKAWPDFYDAYYQLAYCLTLKNKNAQAKDIIEELLQKNPNYDPKAKDLLNHIENSTHKAS